MIGCLLLLVAVVAADRPVAAAEKPVKTATISLTVDYGDGVSKVFVLPYAPSMTVFDALKLAKASPHGLTFVSSGSGATTIVSKIDDMQNQGGGSGKRNWLYWVNDELADRGSGAFKLAAGDAVVWKFETYGQEDDQQK